MSSGMVAGRGSSVSVTCVAPCPSVTHSAAVSVITAWGSGAGLVFHLRNGCLLSPLLNLLSPPHKWVVHAYLTLVSTMLPHHPSSSSPDFYLISKTSLFTVLMSDLCPQGSSPLKKKSQMRSQTINTWPLTGKTQVCVLGLIYVGTNETKALPPTHHRFSLYCRSILLARPTSLPELLVPHPPWLISPYCFNQTCWILFTEILHGCLF